MRPCPYCAQSIEGQAQVCPFCRRPLALPVAPSGTSGKAIGSLICGIFFFFLPSAVVAVVLGHLSLSDIRRSAGRLGGQGLAIVGLVLGYLGLAVIPILIIAAIAIPNLLRAKMAANEASAVGALRTINTACVNYATQYKSYPPTLASLGSGTTPGSDVAGLIDSTLASGKRSGYFFTFQSSGLDGTDPSYQVYADPINPGATGVRHFFSDQTGVIRASVNTRANAESPPL
jgi:type IV pilus assembly protein PilA